MVVTFLLEENWCLVAMVLGTVAGLDLQYYHLGQQQYLATATFSWLQVVLCWNFGSSYSGEPEGGF